jgi:hypothetical protein
MKDASGKTVYFTMVEDQAETAAAAVTAIVSDVEAEEPPTSHHTRRDSDASDYSMLAETEHTALAAKSSNPFAADTGATAHITPFKADDCGTSIWTHA